LCRRLPDSLRTAARTLVGVRCELGPSTAWFRGDRVLQIPAKGLEQVASAVRGSIIPIVPNTSKGGSRLTGHMSVVGTQRRLVIPAERMDLAGIPLISTFDVEITALLESAPVTPAQPRPGGIRCYDHRFDPEYAMLFPPIPEHSGALRTLHY
jgi:hypothetical protein